MMPYTKTKKQGFTLVETLVAISILLLVVVGPMSISMRTAKSASFASEQVQAFFLAQEGLELAQKSRDDFLLLNFLPTTNGSYVSNPWGRFTNSSGSGVYRQCFFAGGCGMQWSLTNYGQLDTIRDCSSGTNTCLLYLTENGRSRFTHSSTGNTPTLFTRRIYFRDIGSGALEVRSVVTWRTGSLVADQSVSTMTYLYNIYALP